MTMWFFPVLVALGLVTGCASVNTVLLDLRPGDRGDREQVRIQLRELVRAYESEDVEAFLSGIDHPGSSGDERRFRRHLNSLFGAVGNIEVTYVIDRIRWVDGSLRVQLHWMRRWNLTSTGGTVTRYGESTAQFCERDGRMKLRGVRGDRLFVRFEMRGGGCTGG